jgi:hypothetical protein
MDPESRISRTGRPQKADSESNGSDACPANCGRFEGAVIDIRALNNEKRISTSLTKSADLSPEPTCDQRSVQIVGALPLYQRCSADVIVSLGKTPPDDDRSQRFQPIRNTAGAFEDVSGDLWCLRAEHPPVDTLFLTSAQAGKQLALLLSKSA